MNYKINEIYSFKLSSGEELVTKVIKVGINELTIGVPVSIAAAQGGLQLIPSMFTADSKAETTLNLNNVSISAECDETIRAKYLEATTGIVLPQNNSKKLILG